MSGDAEDPGLQDDGLLEIKVLANEDRSAVLSEQTLRWMSAGPLHAYLSPPRRGSSPRVKYEIVLKLSMQSDVSQPSRSNMDKIGDYDQESGNQRSKDDSFL